MSLCRPPARPQALSVPDSHGTAGSCTWPVRNKFLWGWQQEELGARRPLRKRLKPAKHSGSSHLRPSLSLNSSHHPWDSPKPGATAGLLQLPPPPEPSARGKGQVPATRLRWGLRSGWKLSSRLQRRTSTEAQALSPERGMGDCTLGIK